MGMDMVMGTDMDIIMDMESLQVHGGRILQKKQGLSL